MTIIEAVKHGDIFRNYLADESGSIKSWSRWLVALRAMYGLRINSKRAAFVKTCTGRNLHTLPKAGFSKSLLLVGRRSGKSKIAGLIAAYEASLSGKEKLLSPGEKGIVAVVAPTTEQADYVKDYVRGAFASTPYTEQEVIREVKDGFDLKNGVSVKIMVGDWRTIRGATVICAIIDEAAFLHQSESGRIRTDKELIRAISPSLATVGGRLVAITSPYAKAGWTFSTYENNFGNPNGNTLVWNCPSRTLNRATLPQSVVDEALRDDPDAARAEYLGQFREDVSTFIGREEIVKCVVKGRKELFPRSSHEYIAVGDLSGGRNDSAALCIGHKNDAGKCVVDKLVSYRAPFDPMQVIREMCREMRRYGINRISTDAYAADFVTRAFEAHGIHAMKLPLPKSDLYLEMLSVINSREVELLDLPSVIEQMSNLERSTRSGGRDKVDHKQGFHDDESNVIAGLCFLTLRKTFIIGGLGSSSNELATIF